MQNPIIQIISCLVLWLMSASSMFAQAPLAPKIEKNFEIYFGNGSIISYGGAAGLSEFSSLLPNSELLNGDFQGFSQSNDNLNYNRAFSFGTAFRPFKNEDGSRKHTKLRVGVNYFQSTPMSLSLNRDDRSPADTLVSMSTGRTVLLDSATYRYLNGNVNVSHLYLDLALMFESNWESRWTGYVGVGLSMGISTVQNVELYYNESVHLEQRERRHFYFDVLSNEGLNEVRNLSTGFGMMLNVPVGIDWRIAKSHPFWSNVSLFAEMRPNLHLAWMPDMDTAVLPGFFSLFGWRVRV